MRIAAVAVALLAFAGGLLLFLARDARGPAGAAASDAATLGAEADAPDAAPPRLEPLEAAAAESLRQEVESPAPASDPNAWTVRVLRDGAPAAKVEVVWVTPEMHRAAITAPDPAIPDWMDRLWHAGLRARTDAAGEARLPALEPESYVFARDGETMAYHRVVPSDAPPIVLVLQRDHALRVRVVDVAGVPQAGCRVMVDIGAGSGSRRSTAITREDGLTTFLHFGVAWGIDLAQAPGLVRLAGLFDPAVEVELDLEPFPEEPVELVLPPHGSVAVEVVDDAGEPARVERPVRLSVDRGRSSGARVLHPSTPATAEVVAGRALFPQVGLGLTLAAELDGRPTHEPARLSFDGPVAAGEARTVRLALDPAALVRFRVLAPTGAALADREVQVSLLRTVAGGSVGSTSSATSDATGTVTLPLTGAWSEGARLSIEASLRTAQGEDLKGSIAIDRPLTRGVNDLGDVILQEPPVLVAGRVVDGASRPIERAAVHLARIKTSRTGREVRSGSAMSTTDEDGRFRIEGESSQDILEMHAEAPEYLPSAPVRVSAGARGLEIVLRSGGGLRGSLRVPAGIPGSAFLVEVAGPQGSTPRRAQPDAAGGFELLGLAPGRVDVAVALRMRDESLTTIEGVEVLEGQTRSDPRLADIELDGLIRRLVIGVRQADGAPARDGWVRVLGSGEPSSSAAAFAIDEGRAKVLGEQAPLDLEINVPGHRLLRLRGVESDQEVQLEPAFSVTLALEDGIELPESGARLQINLDPMGDGAAPRFLTIYDAGEQVGSWHPLIDESKSFGPAREVRFDVQQSGRHRLSFSLVQGDPLSGMVSTGVNARAECREMELQPSDAGRVFRVAPDPDAYAKLLARRR